MHPAVTATPLGTDPDAADGVRRLNTHSLAAACVACTLSQILLPKWHAVGIEVTHVTTPLVAPLSPWRCRRPTCQPRPNQQCSPHDPSISTSTNARPTWRSAHPKAVLPHVGGDGDVELEAHARGVGQALHAALEAVVDVVRAVAGHKVVAAGAHCGEQQGAGAACGALLAGVRGRLRACREGGKRRPEGIVCRQGPSVGEGAGRGLSHSKHPRWTSAWRGRSERVRRWASRMCMPWARQQAVDWVGAGPGQEC